MAPHRTTQQSDHMSKSILQMLPELQQLGAMPTALDSLFRAHRPLVQTLSPTPVCPSPTQLHAVPSGPVAVTESRAQRCPSAPCEELQPPCSAQSTPQVVRQFPAVQNRGQWAGRVMRKWVCSLEDRICYLQQDKDPKAHFLTEGRPRISEGPVGVWGSCKP